MIIRELRRAKGLTQAQLAESAGVTKVSVCKWEAGLTVPRAELLPVLADTLGCTIDALYGREPPGAEAKDAS